MSGEEEPKKRGHRPLAIPLIIAFIVWLVLLLLYALPDLVPPTKLSFELWQNLGNLVLAVMIFWAALSRFTFAPVEEVGEGASPAKERVDECPIEAEVMPEPAGKDVAVAARPKPRAAPSAAAEKVKAVAERAKGVTVASADVPEAAPGSGPTAPEEGVRIVEWPSKKPGGVYSDTLIQVDYDLVLNMRTKLGRVCGNCEGLPECKKRVGGRLPDDVFESNFECKEGLKRELARVRRAKQGEAVAKSAPAPTEAAQVDEARPVEAVPVTESAPSPRVEAETSPAAAAAQPEPEPTEVKEPVRPPEPQAPPPAPGVEAGPVPAAPAAVAKVAPTKDAPEGPHAGAPAPSAPPPAAADEELEVGPEPAPGDTEQPAPPVAKAEGKSKLRKKLLKRKD